MTIRTLPRHARTDGPGWAHPYPVSLFSPVFYADGDEDKDEDAGTEDADADADTDADDEGDDDGADQLGDAGKQALDRMKAKLKAERDKRRTAESERDQLKAKPGEDTSPEQIRAQADQAATARADARIVRSELKAAATGKLADPKDALAFLDLSKFEVDDDGQVDEDEVAEAIEQLLKDKPHLAAATAKRFQGSGDGGARKGSGGPKQLGKTDLKTMTAEQIEEARVKGQLRDYLRE